ncbi:hypothetical protein RF683_04735 [Flavobacterium sp. 20NA77.7]|jgi:hypothetical protein|uniref:DUF3311 domain-containing protein n=1 Tax=Flavobacterium nakdongensis TaxID=3073563 RepID=A0ABY9RBY6_9FLAO|nr:hypothetical protein [Flavobacterium sp. 20NA77.7]WMW78753.1 hypothetical protein RF683_04735 [Flavobacterium sp. 20NA77.7]
MKKRHQQKLIVLSFILLIGFNLPILLLFDKGGFVFGMPVIYLYILSIWLFSIILSYVILKRYYE